MDLAAGLPTEAATLPCGERPLTESAALNLDSCLNKFATGAVALREGARAGAPVPTCAVWLLLSRTEEQLSPSDMWRCPTCKDTVRAFKRMQVPQPRCCRRRGAMCDMCPQLWSLPEVLIVHLKRFQYTQARG